jgi:prenyltransferase beta subunit
MGYHQKIVESSEWLIWHKNPDNGWGLTPEQASSIVNTAEALYVLKKANRYHQHIKLGLEYIQQFLPSHVEERGHRIRYVNFALLAYIENQELVDHSEVTRWADWLMNAKNADGAWGQVANDEESRLFPTCLTLMLLSKLNYREKDLAPAFNWVMKKKKTTGWSFDFDDSPSSQTATALAVLALKHDKDLDEENYSNSKDLLLTTQWTTEPEAERGAAWRHCTYQWIFPALMALGVEPYHKTIAEGVRGINSYGFDGGWREPDGNKTVRGQFWAVFALDAIYRAYDPAVHTYRIDSERSQSALVEPTFVNILVNTKWATIVPKRFYQATIYVLFAVSLTSFLGLHRALSHIPREADLVISALLFIGTYRLVKARKDLFPKWLVWVVITIAVILLRFSIECD